METTTLMYATLDKLQALLTFEKELRCKYFDIKMYPFTFQIISLLKCLKT